MTTQPIPLSTPVVRMPRGTAASGRTQPEAARNGTGHLNGRLASATCLIFAVLASLLVTALMRIAL
jgi:hypothetical protein